MITANGLLIDVTKVIVKCTREQETCVQAWMILLKVILARHAPTANAVIAIIGIIDNPAAPW